MSDEPIALQIPDAVKASGLGRSTLYRAIQDGKLPARKAGKRTLILVEDLRAFILGFPVRVGKEKAK